MSINKVLEESVFLLINKLLKTTVLYDFIERAAKGIVKVGGKNKVEYNDFINLETVHHKTFMKLQELTEDHNKTRDELYGLMGAHHKTWQELQGLSGAHHETYMELQDLQVTVSSIARYNKRLEKAIDNEISELKSTIAVHSDELSTHSQALTSLADSMKAHFELSSNEISELKSTIAVHSDELSTHSQALTSLADSMKAHFEALSSQTETIKGHTDTLADHSNNLKNLSDTLAADSKTFSELWSRLDFIRSELLYEFMYSDKKKASKGQVKAQILNKEKYEAMKDNYKINLGCGQVQIEGYLNIDKRRLPGVDIVADVNNLPFEKETVLELFSSHLIEHFPEEELKRQLLPSWYNLIKKGGMLRTVLPDSVTMMEQYLKGDFPFERLRMVTFGAQDYDGDFHYNMFSKESLKNLFLEVGLVNIEFPVIGRWNSGCYEMEVVGYK